MTYHKAGLISSAMGLGMLALSAWAWAAIPSGQPIPVHYGLDGLPDLYSAKAEGLLVMPLLAMGLTAILATLPTFDPLARNLCRSQKAYAMTWVAAIALIALIHGAIILQALGWSINMAQAVGAGVGLLFMVMGYGLGQVRRNHIFGVRTPWTLGSDRVWHQTNRLGGRLLSGLGLGSLLAALARAPGVVLSLALGVGTLAISVGMVIYSYWLWHDGSAEEQPLP